MNEENKDLAPVAPGFHDDRNTDHERQAPPQSPRYRGRAGMPYKSPVLAGFLSTFCGLGHVYLGYYQQGFIHAMLFGTIIVGLSTIHVAGVSVLLGLSLAYLWFYNLIDAVRRASMINRALDGLTTTDLPTDFELPGTNGSMLGGIALVVIGTMIVLETNFDIDMRWLEDWWSLGLVGLGGYLIYKSRKEKKGAD